MAGAGQGKAHPEEEGEGADGDTKAVHHVVLHEMTG